MTVLQSQYELPELPIFMSEAPAEIPWHLTNRKSQIQLEDF